MKTTHIITLGILFLLSGCKVNKETTIVNKKPNVLFIAIDDLRPELACYGASHIQSPNIDMLASQGVLFSSAYTQQAVCGPSRNTLLTGLRPDELGITDLSTFFRTKAPNVITLSQYFMQNGYQAEGMGKIYHTGHGNSNDTLSWSNKHFTSNSIINKRQHIQSGDTTDLHTSKPKINGKRIPFLKVNEGSKNVLNDELVVAHALERLEALKDTTFFMAVGIAKPHLPFVAPEKYWNMYDPNSIIIPSKEKPNDHPKYSFSNWGELRKYHGIPANGNLSDEQAINLIHGYRACVSYSDALVGKLITKLKQLNLYENTIIVIWGDHGYKLGDYGDWCKHTNYEIDTRIPLIIKNANATEKGGFTTNTLVETVDVYPTLCALAGLETPKHVQGTSFAEVLSNPEFDWDDVAISQYPRNSTINGKKVKLMGYAMRTKNYRFIKWININTKETIDFELYNHSNGEFEMKNLAKDANYKVLVDSLNEKFEKEYAKEHK